MWPILAVFCTLPSCAHVEFFIRTHVHVFSYGIRVTQWPLMVAQYVKTQIIRVDLATSHGNKILWFLVKYKMWTLIFVVFELDMTIYPLRICSFGIRELIMRPLLFFFLFCFLVRASSLFARKILTKSCKGPNRDKLKFSRVRFKLFNGKGFNSIVSLPLLSSKILNYVIPAKYGEV